MNGLSLLAPLGLAALAALPIVLLLHMRHTTPNLRPVPTLRFWLAAQPEPSEQVRLRRPPITALLLLHLLLAALLGAALARPATTAAVDALGGFGLNLRTESRHLILLLDGSTSMSATDAPGGSRFVAACAAAGDRLAGLREGDVATVLLLGTRTTTFQGTDAAGFALLRERVRRMDPPGGQADLDAALALAKDLLLPGLADQVVVLTDGAVAADPATVAAVGAPVELVRVGDPATANVAITEFSARANLANPDQLEVYLRIANFGDAAVSASPILDGDGLEIGRDTVSLPPAASAELSWLAPPGTAAVTARVEAPDALPADNVASLLLRQDEEGGLALRVLVVSDASSALLRLLQVLPGAEITTQGSDVPLPVAEAYDLLVLEGVTPPPGPLPAPALVVHPPEGGPFATRGAMPAPTVSRLRAQDPLLAGVDLAGVTFGDTPIYALDGTQTEVVGAPDGPLVFRAALGGQPAIVFAFDVAASNLPRRVAFPILMQNAVAQLAPSPLPPALPLGDPLVYRPRADAATVRVAPPGGEPVELPLGIAAVPDPAPTAGAGAASGELERLREVAYADTGRPGVYAVTELDAAGEELGGGRFVVNAGHPRESNLRANPTLAGTLAGARAAGDSGAAAGMADLWPLLVAVALALLAVEWLVALIPRRRFRPRPAALGLNLAGGCRGRRE